MQTVTHVRKTSKTKPSKKVRALMDEAEPWLAWLATQGRSPRTILDYRWVVRAFARFLVQSPGVLFMRDVQRSTMEAWLRGLIRKKLSPVTVGCYVHPLLGLFSWFTARGEMFFNPCSDLELPKTPRRLLPVLSEADMVRLVTSVTGETPVDLRDRAILEVAYASGLRCRELVSLDVQSIDLGEGVVRTVGKAEKERVSLFTRAASIATARYLGGARSQFAGSSDDGRALWLNERSGQRLTTQELRFIVSRRAKAIGLTLTPHGIRRAFATHLLGNGASPLELRRMLGHVSYQHLRHYLRYSLNDLMATHRRSNLGL